MSKRASLKRLQLCNFKLDTLLNITKAINNNLPTRKLLSQYERLLRDELNIGKLAIYTFNKRWIRILKSGFQDTPSALNISIEKDLLNITEITTTTSSSSAFIRTFDLIIPVYHNKVPLAYVLIGDIDEEQEGISPTIKHLQFIQTLTNIIVVAIENKRLYKENIRQEALKKELELASKMQAMLIPKPSQFPRDDIIFVDAFYLPHFDVGGDYYDFFRINEQEYAFCIADVSGKGISAAILMSNFQANLKALFTSNISLPELVTTLNERVINSTRGERFITLFVAKYNTVTKRLEYINAGHNPPLLYDTKHFSLSYLKTGCIGIGMLDEMPEISKGVIDLKPGKFGTKLLCYTDGLVELRGGEDIESCIQVIANFMSDNKRIDQTISTLIQALDIDKENSLFFDDVSVLGVEFY